MLVYAGIQLRYSDHPRLLQMRCYPFPVYRRKLKFTDCQGSARILLRPTYKYRFQRHRPPRQDHA